MGRASASATVAGGDEGGRAAIETLILVPDEASADEVTRILGARFLGADRTVAVRVIDGDIALSVTEASGRQGAQPLGVLAGSEEAALEAISAGADEAMPVPVLDQRSVNALLERTVQRASLRREEETRRTSVAHAEKLAALGTVVAGVAHEINNPLTAVLLSVEAFRVQMSPLLETAARLERLVATRRGVSADELVDLAAGARTGTTTVEGHAMLDEIVSATQSIAGVVRDLRVFARGDEDEQPQLVHAADLVDQVLRIVGREISENAQIERDYAPDLPPLVLPRSRLTQVVTNVLLNAAHAIREIARPLHRVRISLRSDGEFVAIAISDTGPGIPASSLERIFDPFYTTKRDNLGTGLGLSISRSILRRLGGDLVVESVHGDGATFVALMPIPDEATVREAFARGRSRVPVMVGRRTAVLVVDEDDRVLRAASRALREACDVLLASDGQEAIDLLRSGSHVDVVVAALVLPEVDGSGLHAWLSREQPALASRMVFLSEGPELPRFPGIASSGAPVLEKPVARDALLRAIQSVAPR